MRTILKGNIIHAPQLGQLSITPKGYLVLEDGVIEGIYEQLPVQFAADPVEDYGDRLIMQSFADLHLHAPQYPMLGLGMDLQLLEWLNAYTYELEATFADTEFARKIYRKLAKELIDLGTTRVSMFSSIHREATHVLMEELEAAGVTGYVGKLNMDRFSPDNLRETAEESIRETRRWVEECAERYQHVKPAITPRFTPSCTDELMAELGKLVKEKNLPVQSHLSENPAEIQWVRELHPDCEQYWQTYAKFGLWNDKTLMAHCIYSDERERTAMRETGVTVVYCADSNTNVYSGVAPIRQMLNEGVKVALGSDIAGGAQLSMWDVTAMSIRISKQRLIHDPAKPPFLTVPEAYYLGTTAGHKCFGAGEGFAVGDKLHAVVVDDSNFPVSYRELTLAERFERTIYLTKKENICAVYSEGRKVKG